MRLVLILSVLVLTAGTVFSAISTLPNQMDASAEADAPNGGSVVEVEMLQKTVSELEAKNSAQLAELEETVADRDRLGAENEQLMAQVSATAATVNDLTEKNRAAQDQIAALQSDAARSRAEVDDAQTTIAALNETVNEGRRTIDTLEAELAGATAKTASMTVQLAAIENDIVTGPAASDARVADMQSRVDRMSRALEAAEERILTLQAESQERAMAATKMTDQAAEAESEIAALRAEISALTSSIDDREAPVVAQGAEAEPGPEMTVAICRERTDAIFAEQKLTFDRGTAKIAENSIRPLEQLIETAQQCADAGLIVEIGGHTDSQGGEQSNQTLSEERARAVLDFLYAGGVPSVAMRAVGYGESKPIADNATSDGRSQNRRIDFEWQSL